LSVSQVSDVVDEGLPAGLADDPVASALAHSCLDAVVLGGLLGETWPDDPVMMRGVDGAQNGGRVLHVVVEGEAFCPAGAEAGTITPCGARVW
jgi:hypothetical protein